MESQEAGFPLFPHLLEIPAGFPHYSGYGCDCLSSEDGKPAENRDRSHSHHEGLVKHVCGFDVRVHSRLLPRIQARGRVV